MKSLLILPVLLCLGLHITAQQKDVTVFEKKDGNKNIVVARNTGKVPYLVTLKIHATGMDVTPGLTAETVVPAGYMKELATLTPQPGQSWTYGYDVSYLEYKTDATPQTSTTLANVAATAPAKNESSVKTPASSTTVATDDKEIIVYTKPGCSRCAFVKKSLDEKGIKYKVVDVTSGSPDANDMWMDLRKGGFTGESVTMPVVKSDGKLHYNIADLNKFVSSLSN